MEDSQMMVSCGLQPETVEVISFVMFIDGVAHGGEKEDTGDQEQRQICSVLSDKYVSSTVCSFLSSKPEMCQKNNRNITSRLKILVKP